MKTKLSEEQRRALTTHPDGIEVEDAQTQKLYFLTDADQHHRAIDALKKQENLDAIQCGIDDMEAGQVIPFKEVDQRIRNKLGIASKL